MRIPLRLVALILALCPIVAALTVAPAFSDHMVLQAGQPISIRGTAEPAAVVSVALAGTVRTSIADAAGQWELQWPSLPRTQGDVGIEFKITSGSAAINIHDVMVGEVWLCSGQSNMRFALGRNYVQPDAKSPNLFPGEIAQSANPRIRLLCVSAGSASDVRTPADRKWGVCSPANAVGFSAIGYFFGRELAAALPGVAIGLIDLGKGGEPIRGFLAKDLISASPALAKAVPPLAPKHLDPTGEVFAKDLMWLAPFAIRGVIWYQGESEVARARDYPLWMGALIDEWRTVLGSNEAQFLIVQLPVYERHRTDPVPSRPGTHWAELRAAQLTVGDAVKGVFVTPALDLGEQFEIHPHRKPEVGLRLARLAETHAYGLAVPSDAPRFLSAVRDADSCTLTFSHAEGGIVSGADELTTFEIVDKGGTSTPVQARISGNDTVKVLLPPGLGATVLRYGWRDFFAPCLYNGESLPIFPFSIDLKEAKSGASQ